MSAKKPNTKSTKAEILQAYEELAKEQEALRNQLEKAQKQTPLVPTEKAKSEPKIEPKIEINPEIKAEPKTVMNQTTSIQQKMDNTIESLTKIQLGFGSAANELSEQLTTRASKLAEITEAVNNEIQQLTELHNLEISEDILDTLIQTYDDNAKADQEEYNQRYELLSQEIEELKNAWTKEQEEYQRTIKERNDNLNKTRQRDAAEYKYDLEMQRKLASEEYAQQEKLLYRELEELQQTTEKQWNEREKAISEREKQFEELKTKVEAFPKEKEAAIKKATDEGKGIATYQAKVKSDLYAKEVEGQKRFYEQRLQSLEQTITNQEKRLQNLSSQLESALKQVQDLAVKAIEGTANVNSYQAIKEIALEQAKSQVKNK
jgi:DNA repair exonuclease SbcCD ATPase subunit